MHNEERKKEKRDCTVCKGWRIVEIPLTATRIPGAIRVHLQKLGGIYSYDDIGNGNKYKTYILQYILPLICCRVFFLLSFYLNFSSHEKLQKRPALQKQSFCVLLRSCKQHPSVTQNLPQTTFRSVIGDKRTRFPRNNSNADIHRSNSFYPVSAV